jgi:hypothetical protein
VRVLVTPHGRLSHLRRALPRAKALRAAGHDAGVQGYHFSIIRRPAVEHLATLMRDALAVEPTEPA